MLHDFVTANRQVLIGRCKEKAAKRFEPAEAAASDHGVPLFLEQLVDTLRTEQTTEIRNLETEAAPARTEIGRAASLYGADLLRRGFSVDQLVHDYGDVCQCVTSLAVEQHVLISNDEFRTLNRCLDNAIADAVASFGCARQSSIDRQVETMQQRLTAFCNEHQRLTEIAIQAFAAIKTGNVGTSGATGALLAHTLEELRLLKERALPDSFLASATPPGGAALTSRASSGLGRRCTDPVRKGL